MHQIRFFEIPCHLSQQTVGRDSDIHRKLKLLFNLILQLMGERHRLAIQHLIPGEVRPGFVNAVLNHLVGILLQQRDQGFGFLHINMKIRRYDNQVRTFLSRGHNRFPGLDAIFSGRCALGKHDPVARLLIPSHNGGHRTQIQFFPEDIRTVSRTPA